MIRARAACVVGSQAPVYNDRMDHRFLVRSLTLFALLFFVAATAWAAEIVVSTDGSGAFRSIQRAIDAAAYGDAILVNPGLYEETLTLKSGITIRGAGASHTIVRSSYGYQPVLQGTSVGAVLLEDLSFERAASILEAAVVELASSHVTFDRCRISGGQQGGVMVSGVSTLAFQGCEISSNQGYGLQASGSVNVTMKASTIADNGSVGIYLRDASAVIESTTVQWNGWDGIDAEGTTVLSLENTTVSNNGRWGIRLSDTSLASLNHCTLTTHATGNIQSEASASLTLESCQLEGGILSSVEANATSTVHLADTRILSAAGDGLALRDQAALIAKRTLVAHCSGSGLSLMTDGDCQLFRVTSAYNGSHGLEFRGNRLEATHNILALNAGIGIRISAPSGPSQSLQLDYNNVWGNRSGDYSGTFRSSSDISQAPDFLDPSASDFSLSADSPCIDAGEFGSMIGAAENPRWAGQARIELGLAHAEDDWGTLRVGAGVSPKNTPLLDGFAGWSYDWGTGSLDAEARLRGWDRFTANGAFKWMPLDRITIWNGQLDSTLSLTGVWDDAASRWEACADLSLTGATSSLSMATSYEGPTGLSHQRAQLTISGLSLAVQATELTLTTLDLSWAAGFSKTSQMPLFDLNVRLVPDLRVSVTSQWDVGDESFRFSANAYIRQMSTAVFSLAWSDHKATNVNVELSLRSGQFEDAALSVELNLTALRLGATLGANVDTGPRCGLSVWVVTREGAAPAANQPPMPAFAYTPREPEAGETMTFDASGSTDPEGQIDQIWWDFGDGGSAIGQVVTHRYSAPGDYMVTLTVSDRRGAVTSLIETLAVIESQTTPTASFIWAPVSEGGARLQRALRAGDRILLDATDSRDPNGEIVEFHWDIQSDGVFDYISQDPRLIIDPLSAGTWPMTLRVVDSDGYSDAIMRVLPIEDLKPPLADFQWSPSAPAVGDPIRFIDTSVAQDGVLLTWEWDFDNGYTSRDVEPNTRYQKAGGFDVRLTVRDSEGLASTIVKRVPVGVNPELAPIAQTWALVIGISDYLEVEDLSYARRDAEAIAAWLLDADVPADHIRLLTDDEPKPTDGALSTLDTRLANLVNVREGLGWLRQVAKQDDLVIIHFSGHGYQGADDDFDERDGVDEFFVLQDTRAAAKDDTALRDDEFGRFLDRIESDHVLVFFDSCYSGGLSRSLAPGSRATGEIPDVFSDFELEGRLVLSASSETQDAFESPQLQHGVLTHFLLQGLDGAGDLNGDGHITVWELFEYVYTHVPPFVLKERGELQYPQLLGEGESRVVLTRAPGAVSFAYCPTTPFAGAATWFRVQRPGEDEIEPAIWDFGDGGESTVADPMHRYEQPGTYSVRLVISTDASPSQTASQSIQVADWARIVSADAETSQAFISVGRQHGVNIGDQFALAVDTPAGASVVPLLEIIELMDENAALCQILDQGTSLETGARLRPITDPDDQPCWPAK